MQHLADDFGERQIQRFGKALVDSLDAAVEAQIEDQVIEAVDQVAIAALRAGHHVEHFFDLRFGDRGVGALLHAAKKGPQFDHFFALVPNINAEEAHENDQADRKSFETHRQHAESLPRSDREPQRHEEQNYQDVAPERAFALLHLVPVDVAELGFGDSSGALANFEFGASVMNGNPLVPQN